MPRLGPARRFMNAFRREQLFVGAGRVPILNTRLPVRSDCFHPASVRHLPDAYITVSTTYARFGSPLNGNCTFLIRSAPASWKR